MDLQRAGKTAVVAAASGGLGDGDLIVGARRSSSATIRQGDRAAGPHAVEQRGAEIASHQIERRLDLPDRRDKHRLGVVHAGVRAQLVQRGVVVGTRQGGDRDAARDRRLQAEVVQLE
ncbi:hypothetical protein SMC26_34165 [Actinomadura fulvescens]|uniref:Uncharacterized protein n=1 Tax=Actinomadura fulvescens TaxID=46160 RepID=A0ABP6C0A6_9ACTN